MTRIYCVQDNDFGNGFVYFAKKSEACAYARDAANHRDEEVEVNADVVAKLPRAQLFAALLNNEGWSTSGETELVFLARPRKRRAA